MPDATLAAHWGLRPVLFHAGAVAVPAYEVFVALGLVAGIALVLWQTRDERGDQGGAVWIVGAALAGGALGAKLLEWALMPWADLERAGLAGALLAGRTVIGGFVGGSLAVVIVKRRLGIRERRGNVLAPAIAAGLAIGRIGCLCRGCCYGTPTGLPWGVDFGDGVFRHPTQLYEALFALVVFAVLWSRRHRAVAPGRLLTLFMLWYFAFRFAEEFVRAGDRVALGLTVYQFAALAALLWFACKDRLLPGMTPARARP